MYNKPDFFVGNWKASRIVDDRLYQEGFVDIVGTASFKKLEDEASHDQNTIILQYSEEFFLKFPDSVYITRSIRATTFTKQYQYHFCDGNITKYNQQNNQQSVGNPHRKMFDFTYIDSVPIEGQTSDACAIGSYKCGYDMYKCIIYFASTNSFKMVYEVIGPNKNYTATTIFERELTAGDEIELAGDRDAASGVEGCHSQ